MYHSIALICGHDFRFGAGGGGTAALLLEACAKAGIGCAVIPEYRLEGITVSSTYIRTLLEAGDLDRARRFLGHPHQMTGTVVSGAHLGRTLGIPTANLEVSRELLLPPKGVYACRARTAEGTYLAVTNIGTRPTVNGRSLTIEPWLLDYAGDLYGQPVTLELWHYLRESGALPVWRPSKERSIQTQTKPEPFLPASPMHGRSRFGKHGIHPERTRRSML
ncbi:MAG: riboflavin kinase [Oscillospiraceae bacterium]